MDVGIEDVEDILVVDDNSGDIRLIEEAFRASPFDPAIHATTTRVDALDLLCRREGYEEVPRPDVVLLDWNLSKHTGEKVIEAAKSSDPPIPVVVMTGAKSALPQIKSSAPEADQYIEKQTDPQAYIDMFRPDGAEP